MNLLKLKSYNVIPLLKIVKWLPLSIKSFQWPMKPLAVSIHLLTILLLTLLQFHWASTFNELVLLLHQDFCPSCSFSLESSFHQISSSLTPLPSLNYTCLVRPTFTTLLNSATCLLPLATLLTPIPGFSII